MTVRRITGVFTRSKTLLCCMVAMILLAVAMHYYALPKRSVTMAKTTVGSKSVPIRLPSLIPLANRDGKGFIFSLELNYDYWPLQQTGFQFITNGCIRKILVNGREFPFRSNERCNPRFHSHWNPYGKPLYLDLAPALKSGPNSILIKSDKAEFSIGPAILYHNLRLSKWLGLMMAAVCCIALFKIMKLHNKENISGYILAAGFLVHLHRFSYNGLMEKAMDMPLHLIYITFIARHGRWPNPYDGWAFYHPPLYYTIEAIIMRFANWLNSFDAMTLMQAFSLGCFMLFLIFSAMSLHRLIRNRIAYNTALVLLVFYPSGILFSSHIDSHAMFYACHAACLYFMLRWLEDPKHRHLGIALICLGMGIATRSNALILLPLAGLAFIYNIGRGRVSRDMLRSYMVYIGLLVLCLGFMTNFGRIIYYQFMESRHDPLIVGNISRLSRGLLLNNDSLWTMLMPNIPNYLTHPFWSVWVDNDGRQHFWNSMLKSSLTGEYGWGKPKIALAMAKLLLAIIVFIIDAYIIHRQALRERREWALCMFGLFIPVAALFANRWFYPYACSEDFRYIYPALASFCGLMGLTLEQHLKDWRPFRTALGVLLCVSFAYSAVYFYT